MFAVKPRVPFLSGTDHRLGEGVMLSQCSAEKSKNGQHESSCSTQSARKCYFSTQNKKVL